MSFFFRFDKSTPGSIVQKITGRQFSIAEQWAPNYRANPGVRSYSDKHVVSQNEFITRYFIGALVNAGQCWRHKYPLPKGNHRRPGFQALGRRLNHAQALQVAPVKPASQEELLGLVDQYDIGHWARQYSPESEFQRSPGPHLIVSDKPDDSEWPPPQHVWNLEGKDAMILRKLEISLSDPHHDPEESYQLYRALPAPRAPYLRATTRHRLLRNLGLASQKEKNIGVKPRKDKNAMLRYFTVIDDMKVTAIPLSVMEWNIALSFAKSYVSNITEAEVESGLQLFREMEHVAGVRANSATFNILFDMATKAGKFNLAEMIYKEMERRGHPFNRFHYVTKIYFYGCRGDGDGVRYAYKSLVEGGEIVDTVVLNCMISSLIQAGEPESAELVYERMKILHSEKENSPLPPTDYSEQRRITNAFLQMANIAKRHPDKLEGYRARSIVAPDSQTYRILVQHTAVHSGDLHKTAKLLDEMQWYQLPLSGSIFLWLFQGFARHGGIRYSQWTIERLESVWKAYRNAVTTQGNANEEVYIGKWMIVWALKAFWKCAGKDRAGEIWEEIFPLWVHDDDELSFVMDTLRSLRETPDLDPLNPSKSP